ncbi:aminobenzoyl-glutamate transporter [Synergistales bacterium]|nr:aminobenzoyl-glutamate transporter [Synergistales bacterium]
MRDQEFQVSESALKKKGFLAWIERVGNKMPHPFVMFLEIITIVLGCSFVFGMMGASAVHPTSKETITVVNLISIKGLLFFMDNFVKNFQTFPVLGIVLVLGVATGLCDRTGFFSTAIKMGLANKKGNTVVFIIAIIGIVAHNAGDVSFILVPAIAGAMFYGMHRHPLAGVFLGYASVGGGFTTTLIPSGMDAILAPVTIQAANTILPGFYMPLLCGYFFLFVSGLLCAIAATYITIKVIEPMLGKYEAGEGTSATDMNVLPEEAKAVKKAGLAVLAFIILLVLLCIPSNSFLRNPETGSLIFRAPFMTDMQFFIIVIFALAGVVYGVSVGKIRSFIDAIKLMEDATKTLAPFIVLAIVIGQFLALFDQSKLGHVLAIRGGQFLASLPVPMAVIVLLFLLLTTVINLFIGSGSTKWLLMGPIFVPMLMQLNLNPAFIQSVYRLGDSATNHLTPLFAYFAILLTTAQGYDKKTGMGTLFSAMLPYSAAFLCVYAVQTFVWMMFDLPTGFGGGIWLN